MDREPQGAPVKECLGDMQDHLERPLADGDVLQARVPQGRAGLFGRVQIELHGDGASTRLARCIGEDALIADRHRAGILPHGQGRYACRAAHQCHTRHEHPPHAAPSAHVALRFVARMSGAAMGTAESRNRRSHQTGLTWSISALAAGAPTPLRGCVPRRRPAPRGRSREARQRAGHLPRRGCGSHRSR